MRLAAEALAVGEHPYDYAARRISEGPRNNYEYLVATHTQTDWSRPVPLFGDKIKTIPSSEFRDHSLQLLARKKEEIEKYEREARNLEVLRTKEDTSRPENISRNILRELEKM